MFTSTWDTSSGDDDNDEDEDDNNDDNDEMKTLKHKKKKDKLYEKLPHISEQGLTFVRKMFVLCELNVFSEKFGNLSLHVYVKIHLRK